VRSCSNPLLLLGKKKKARRRRRLKRQGERNGRVVSAAWGEGKESGNSHENGARYCLKKRRTVTRTCLRAGAGKKKKKAFVKPSSKKENSPAATQQKGPSPRRKKGGEWKTASYNGEAFAAESVHITDIKKLYANAGGEKKRPVYLAEEEKESRPCSRQCCHFTCRAGKKTRGEPPPPREETPKKKRESLHGHFSAKVKRPVRARRRLRATRKRRGK